MSDHDHELLADLLEDYHRRRALGEGPTPDDYLERSGSSFAEFERILEAEEALDGVIDPIEGPSFPMAFERYTLLAELGRGAAGVVYEAVDRELGRTVAIKVLRTGFDTQPVAIERFKREAKACAQVRHDNIVRVHEAGQHDGRHFYVMSRLEGRTLKDLSRDGKLPEPRAFAGALAGVADALHALHERGIVHRDLKPTNIMVEPSGRMILADFGLARTVASESLTQTGEALGTPLYMSPEQLLGASKQIDGRTDVYGMGAAMYHALAGRPVFETDSVEKLMRMILAERPQPLREVDPEIPRELERIVMKALEKKSDDRYPDAAALRDDLLAFSRGEQVVGKPVSGMRHAMRRSWRFRWAAAAAVAVVGIGAAIWALRPPEPAQVELASVPSAASVYYDGVASGAKTPLDFELAPGRHVVTVRKEGYHERRIDVDVTAGQRWRDHVLLVPTDPKDERTVAELGEYVGLALSKWRQTKVRAGGPGRMQMWFPRGDVRPENVTSYRLVAADGSDDGYIIFEADGEELYRRRMDGDWPTSSGANSFDLPAKVRDALKAGKKITWGFHPDRKRAPKILASFQRGKTDVVARLKSLDEKLKGQHEHTRRTFRAQALLDAGYAQEAYEVARAAPDALASRVALGIMQAALVKLEMTDTALWVESSKLQTK